MLGRCLNAYRIFRVIAFYILVDVFSVVLVEQFWSLANSSYKTGAGKRWYGVIGSGGLAGGIAGGALASFLIEKLSFETLDLLLVSAALLFLLIAVNAFVNRLGYYKEHTSSSKVPESGKLHAEGLKEILNSRYLLLITATLLLAQLAAPIIEYQFMGAVESAIEARDMRTAFLSKFLSTVGLAALLINFFITPIVHKNLGVIVGLSAQPGLLLIAIVFYYLSPALWSGALLKISDRGLSYSLNRASKELLYIPLEPEQIYRSKAWIDMFGYRFFKVLSSVIILSLTEWFWLRLAPEDLSFVSFAIACFWIWTIVLLNAEYKKFSES